MIKKYRSCFGKIEAWDVVRETPKTVIVINHLGREVREHKVTSWYSYHDTFEEAKQHLIDKAQEEVNKAESILKSKKETLEKTKALQEHPETHNDR